MLLVLALLALNLAQAAMPMVLPADERRTDWAEAMELGDFFDASSSPDGPHARLIREGDDWWLVVLDLAGEEHRLRVAAPTTSDQREDIVWLALSLLHPVESSSPPRPLPPLPMPASKPRPRRAPPPVPSPPAPSSPPPDPAPTAGEQAFETPPSTGFLLTQVPILASPEAPPPDAAPSQPAPERPVEERPSILQNPLPDLDATDPPQEPTDVLLALGVGFLFREAIRTGPSFALHVELPATSAWGGGIWTRFTPGQSLDTAPQMELQSLDFGIIGRRRVTPHLVPGFYLGLSRRRAEHPDVTPSKGFVPFLGPEVCLPFKLQRLYLAPTVTLGLDLRGSSLIKGLEPSGTLSPLTWLIHLPVGTVFSSRK